MLILFSRTPFLRYSLCCCSAALVWGGVDGQNRCYVVETLREDDYDDEADALAATAASAAR